MGFELANIDDMRGAAMVGRQGARIGTLEDVCIAVVAVGPPAGGD